MPIRAHWITKAAAASLVMCSTGAVAQLRYQADNLGQCANIANAAANDIYADRKLKLDQQFYRERLQRVDEQNVVYRQSLRDLERSRSSQTAEILTNCQALLKANGSKPFVYSWTERR